MGRTKISRIEVNKAAVSDYKTFFRKCDQNYERRIQGIAKRIGSAESHSKIILMSGPSASGKTTTSLKIKQELEKNGIRAITISMDDFFKNRDQAPLNPDGSKDYESLDAIDLDLFQSVLSRLIYEGRAELPVFNFKKGVRDEQTKSVELSGGNVAVVEGLHALDSKVTQGLPAAYIMKIYVSVSSDFIGENGEVELGARDVRLIRRAIRDYHFRGSSPDNTLNMWDAVCRGEDLYVRPFKKSADVTLNSIFSCEPCLFSGLAAKLFGIVHPDSRHYDRAQRIIRALSMFESIPLEIIPGSCMLREFIGGSIYYNKSKKTREI